MLAPALLLIPLLHGTAPARVELVFGGDVIPHGEVKRAAADHARQAPPGDGPARSLNHEGWDQLFGPLADVLRTADVAVVNLETPVTAGRRAVTGPLRFNAPPGLVRALAAAGVEAVSLANNHALDQRREGLAETLRHLAAAGIRGVGAGPSTASAWEPLVLERRGLRLGFLSFTRLLNVSSGPVAPDVPHVAYVPYRARLVAGEVSTGELLERVRAAAARCDALIVTAHWGDEYQPAPREEDRRLAHALLEAGASAVIGHHPHVLQPLETYRTADGRGALVAYSLGNLLANQARHYVHGRQPASHGDPRDSMLLRLTLARRGPGAPVELAAAAVLPVWIENNAATRGRSTRRARHIQPVLLDREEQAIVERLTVLAARPLSREARGERATLERRLTLVRRRRERILPLLPPGVSVGSAELGRSAGASSHRVPWL